EDDVPRALARYEAERRPAVEALQRAAQVSLEWFERTEDYVAMAPVQFAVSLMTRSLRVGHENLRRRDPDLVAEADEWFAATAGVSPRAPRLVPLALGGLALSNRIATVVGPEPGEEGG